MSFQSYLRFDGVLYMTNVISMHEICQNHQVRSNGISRFMSNLHERLMMPTFCMAEPRPLDIEKGNRRWACWKCPKVKKLGELCECPEHGFLMTVEVAKRERLCKE